MVFSSLLMLMCLLALMVGSLLLARVAQDRQEQNMIRLYRLAALDRRRAATRNVIRALQDLDENPELLRILYQGLKSDLVRIQALDPGRADLDAEIRQTHSAISSQAEESRVDKHDKNGGELSEQRRQRLERRTSLASEREIMISKAYINEAMVIVRRLYDQRQVRAEQMEAMGRYLGTLGVTVAVNSYVYMGELALQQGDKIKALGSYRKAELMLQRGGLTGRDRIERQGLIEARKSELLAQSVNEKGLLLLASGE